MVISTPSEQHELRFFSLHIMQIQKLELYGKKQVKTFKSFLYEYQKAFETLSEPLNANVSGKYFDCSKVYNEWFCIKWNYGLSIFDSINNKRMPSNFAFGASTLLESGSGYCFRKVQMVWWFMEWWWQQHIIDLVQWIFFTPLNHTTRSN